MYGKAAYSSTTAFMTSFIYFAKSLPFNKELLNFHSSLFLDSFPNVNVSLIIEWIFLVNLYGPNRDDPEFYAELEERINDVGFENIIIGGDWNLVLDYYNYKHHNNIKAQEQVDNLMINLDLLDIWRELYPEMRRYTWRRNTPLQQSRLDCFLISDLLSTFVTNADIKAGYRTDHSTCWREWHADKPRRHHIAGPVQGADVSSVQESFSSEKPICTPSPSLRSFPNVAFETVPMF